MTPICTFCYKTAGAFSWDDIKNENHQCHSTDILLDRFPTLLERFRCAESTEKFCSAASSYQFSSALSCCQDCKTILETFCSEYHKLKCMELQLEWKLQRLADIMKLAGRVPSRVVKLKEVFESLNSNTVDNRMRGNGEEKAGHSAMEGFKKFRHRIIKFCSGHPLKSQPRVWLNRADNVSNITAISDQLSGQQNGSICSETFGTSTAVNEQTTDDVNSVVQSSSDALFGRVMSFAAMVMLLSFNGCLDSFMISEIPNRVTELAAIDELDQFDDFVSDMPEKDLVDNFSLTGSEASDNTGKCNLSPASPVVMHVTAPDRSRNTNNLEETDTNNPISDEDQGHSSHVKDSAGDEASSKPVESLAADSVCNDADDYDLFDMEIKTDEPEEQGEVISDIKCESTLISIDEPPSRNYNLRENRKRVFIKLEQDEDLEESVISDNDSSYSSTSSDSSMSDEEYETASRKMKKIATPDCNSPNAKQFKPRKCLARATACKICGKTFATEKIMKSHIRRAHGTPAICKICNKTFGSEEWLKMHRSRVHIERTLQCSECDKVFKHKEDLKRHMKLHLVPDAWDFKCSICEKKFCVQRSLNRHLKRHKDRKIFPCQFCSMTFPRKSELSSHVRLDHSDKEIAQCSQCSKKFTGKKTLNAHIKEVHREPAYNCSECGKSFARKSKLKIHALIHKGPSAWKFRCSTCGHMCYTKRDLNRHVLTHNKPETFSCQFCEFTCQSAPHLSSHVRTEHIDKEDVGDVNLIKCSECGKKFIEERLLQRHVLHVHAEPCHQCSECGKVFKRKSHLTEHLARHRGPVTGKFRCTICDFTCHQQNKLDRHMIAHEKGTRHNCPLCSSHFTSGQALTLHIRTEHIDKGDHTVFSCSKCDSKYIHKKSLQRHMFQSHPARLHKCPECDKSFRTSQTLKIHSAIHRDPSTWSFPCSECGKRFHQKGAMEKHVLLHHKRMNTLAQKESA